MKIKAKLATILLLCLTSLQTAAADPGTSTTEWKNLPQEGLLAGEGGIGAGSFTIREVWGGENAPLTGSASMTDDKSCAVRVTNRSALRVQLNLEVRQFNAERKIISKNPFLARLDPYKTNERTVKTRNGAIGCGLFVTGWKSLD